MLLLNPKKLVQTHPDPALREIVRKTIAFFETKGKKKLKEDDLDRVWYADFVEFMKKEKIFATLLTPAGYGEDDCRWDTSRLCVFNEIARFLRALLLVHLAGHHPGTRADLDERQ